MLSRLLPKPSREAFAKKICRELVKAGLAWHYVYYSDEEALAQAQEEARKAKRGLWSDARPIPPWEFRRARRGRD